MTTPRKDLTLGVFPFSQLPLYTPPHTPHNYCSEPPPPAPSQLTKMKYTQSSKISAAINHVLQSGSK